MSGSTAALAEPGLLVQFQSFKMVVTLLILVPELPGALVQPFYPGNCSWKAIYNLYGSPG